MAKQIDIVVKESESLLLSLQRQQKHPLQCQRLKALLLIKRKEVTYTYELANILNRSRKTIYNWLKRYQEQELEHYIQIKSPEPQK